MKKLFILFISIISLSLTSCSHNDTEPYDVNCYIKDLYCGTWSPITAKINNKEININPHHPEINNIYRLKISEYRKDVLIVEAEYYYRGEWRYEGVEAMVYLIDGKMYESELDKIQKREWKKLKFHDNSALTYDGDNFRGVRLIKTND